MSRLLLLLFSIGVLGCGGSTLPFEPIDTSLQFGRVGTASAPAGATAPPTVQFADGRIVVLGLMNTGYPCYEIRAHAQTATSVTTVSVEAVGYGEYCAAVLAQFAYRVELAMPTGTERILVQHGYRNPGTAFTVVRDVRVGAQ